MNWWPRFRAAPRKAQVGIGCGTLLVACVIFSCAGGAFASQNVPVATPTTTFRESSSKQPVATNAPTGAPTTAPTTAPTDTAATAPPATPTTPRPAATAVPRVVVTP